MTSKYDCNCSTYYIISWQQSKLNMSYHSTKFPMEPRMLLGIARIHDMLNDPDKAIGFYKKVLILDASNVESIACLGAHYFYADQVNCFHNYI